MARIEQLNKNNMIIRKYSIYSDMRCGSYYHSGTNHRFVGKKEDVEILVYIFKKLKAKITNETEESFIFSHKVERIHRQLFKICRYVRNKSTYQILNTMKKAIEAGVKPYNAIVIAHYCNESFTDYMSSMDIIPRGYFSKARCGFTSFKKWYSKGEEEPNCSINNYYKAMDNPVLNNTKLEKLVQTGEYKKAQSLILTGLWERKKK